MRPSQSCLFPLLGGTGTARELQNLPEADLNELDLLVEDLLEAYTCYVKGTNIRHQGRAVLFAS